MMDVPPDVDIGWDDGTLVRMNYDIIFNSITEKERNECGHW